MADITPPAQPGTSGGGMRDSRYEVENDAIRATLKGIAGRIGASLDTGWGFLLMLFEYGPKGSMFYISSAERGDCLRMAQEWIDKQKASDNLRAQELNPNDKTTRMAHDQWHKIVALSLMRMAQHQGVDPMQIQVNFKQADIDAFAALAGGRAAVGVRDDADGLTLFLTSEEAAIEQIKSGEATLSPPHTKAEIEEMRNVTGA